MKASQPKSGFAVKKPQSTTVSLASSSASSGPSVQGSQPSTAFESPSAAVWSRYVDSRMKQFGTR